MGQFDQPEQTRPASAEAAAHGPFDAIKNAGNEPDSSNNGLNSVDILKSQAHSPAPLRLQPEVKQKNFAPIGTAEMLSDETLILHLRAESTDRKTHGDGELLIHPNESGYSAIKQHIGDINPGEIKFVSPWTDQNGKVTNDIKTADTTGGAIDAGGGRSDTPINGTAKSDTTPPNATNSDTNSVTPGKIPADTTTPGPTGGSGSSGPNTNAPDVIVPASQAFDDSVNKTYNAMSAETREIIRQSGAKVTPVHHLTDAMPELKGQSPRGWPSGATWDAVDGCYSGGKKEIIVAEERQSIGSGKWVPSGRSDEVLRHETGHAVDYTIKMLSDHDDFKKAYDIDIQALPATDKSPLEYFLQSGAAGREETAAEGIADREGGATGGLAFHRDFSNTLKVINDTINVVGKTNGAGRPGQAVPTTNPSTVTPTGITSGGDVTPN